MSDFAQSVSDVAWWSAPHDDLHLPRCRHSDLKSQSGHSLLMRELEVAAVGPGTALKTERQTVKTPVAEMSVSGSELM